MSENIASRVGRLISGTANMLVDAVENTAPEMVMEEAIREVDRAIDDVRSELGRVLSRQHLANRRLSDENNKHSDLTEKVQVALGENRDDLAETAVSQLLDIEAQIPVLEGTITETREAQSELEGYVSALQARKREMKAELSLFRTRANSSGDSISAAPDAASSSGPSSVERHVQKAEEAFERALEGAGGIGGMATAPGRLDAAKRAELDELARKNRIRERLESFRPKDE